MEILKKLLFLGLGVRKHFTSEPLVPLFCCHSNTSLRAARYRNKLQKEAVGPSYQGAPNCSSVFRQQPYQTCPILQARPARGACLWPARPGVCPEPHGTPWKPTSATCMLLVVTLDSKAQRPHPQKCLKNQPHSSAFRQVQCYCSHINKSSN